MADIEYRFREVGADDVIRTFDTITKSAKESARAARQARQSDGGGRAGAKGRMFDAHVKAFDRSQREQSRTEERELKRRSRLSEMAEKAKLRLAERNSKYIERVKFASLAREQREQEKQERKEKQRQAARRQHASRVAASFTGSLAAAGVGKALDLGASGLGKVADVAGGAVRQRLDAKQIAIELAKSGRQAGQNAVSPEVLLREAERVQNSVTGTKASDVLDAQQKYVAMTGNLGQAREFGGTFATMARASGASEQSIAATAATLNQKFGIKTQDEMQKALGDLLFQGKSGAFEMSDAANYLQEMGAAGARFGLGEGSGGVRKLGTLAQLARQSTGSGAEAATAVQSMLSEIVDKSALIKQQTGTDVFTDKSHTKTRSIDDVMVGIVKGAKGDQQKLGKIFGERGIRGMSSMIEAFNKGAAAAGPGASQKDKLDAGEKAMRKMFSDMENAGGSWTEVMKDAAIQSESSIDKMNGAWNKFTTAMGQKLDPAINELAAQAPDLADALTPIVDAAGEVVSSFLDLTTVLQSWGLIDKAAAPKSASERITDAQSGLNELNAISKDNKGLSSRQRMRKRKLEDDLLVAQQDLAKENPLLAKESDLALKTLQAKPGYRKLDIFDTGPKFEDALKMQQPDKGWSSNDIASPAGPSWNPLLGSLSLFKDSLHNKAENVRTTNDAAEVKRDSSAAAAQGAADRQLAAADRLIAAADRLGRTQMPGTPPVLSP